MFSSMSESTSSPFEKQTPLHMAVGVLNKVDRELADLQAGETMVWRTGTVVLLAGGVALGITSVVSLAVLIRKLSAAWSHDDQ